MELPDELKIKIWRQVPHEIRLLAITDNIDDENPESFIFLAPRVVKDGYVVPVSPILRNAAMHYVDGVANEVSMEKYGLHVPVPDYIGFKKDPQRSREFADLGLYRKYNGTSIRFLNPPTDIIFLQDYDVTCQTISSFLKHMTRNPANHPRVFHRFAVDASSLLTINPVHDYADCELLTDSLVDMLAWQFQDAGIRVEMLFVLAGRYCGQGAEGEAAEEIRGKIKEGLAAEEIQDKIEEDLCQSKRRWAIRRMKWVETTEDLNVQEDEYVSYDLDIQFNQELYDRDVLRFLD